MDERLQKQELAITLHDCITFFLTHFETNDTDHLAQLLKMLPERFAKGKISFSLNVDALEG